MGRTGTLLSVDIALEQAGTEGVVDIQGIVSRLREQRMMMVQTHVGPLFYRTVSIVYFSRLFRMTLNFSHVLRITYNIMVYTYVQCPSDTNK